MVVIAITNLFNKIIDMLNILIIQNGYCTTSVDKIINNILLNKKAKLMIIKSYENHLNYNTHKFIKMWNRIIILGGYQSAGNLENFPYLKKVMELIKIGVSLNIPIFGICLGCQLIARAYNNPIMKMETSQVGYHPVLTMTDEGLNDPIFNNMHNLDNILSFHVDTFKIKKDNPVKVLATYFYKDKSYPYMIKIGSAYGVQFHPEVNLQVLKCYLEMKCDILFDKNKMNEILKYAEENQKIIIYTGTRIINNWLLQTN